MDPIVVSYSELDTYRQCPLKHMWAYKERWTIPKEGGSALHRGTLWHRVLEDHYRTLQTVWDEGGVTNTTDEYDPDILARCAKAARVHLFADDGDYINEDAELIDWMYSGHIDKYGIDKDWRPVAVEFPFQIPLLNENGRPSRYHIKGKIDLIMVHQYTGLLWILDHKSGANLPSQMDLEIDDQFGLYTWAMRQLGWDIVGSIHSAARTKRNTADFPGYTGKLKAQTLEDRYRRTLLNRSDTETTAVARDAYAAARNAYPPKSKQLPLYSSPDPRQCGWKCDFKETHLLSRQGVDPTAALSSSGFIQDFTRHN